MLTTETTGKKPAPKNCTIVIPKGKLPLLLAELTKAGLILPAEYVTAESLVGMLDSAVLTLIAAKGESLLGLDSGPAEDLLGERVAREATNSPLTEF